MLPILFDQWSNIYKNNNKHHPPWTVLYCTWINLMSNTSLMMMMMIRCRVSVCFWFYSKSKRMNRNKWNTNIWPNGKSNQINLFLFFFGFLACHCSCNMVVFVGFFIHLFFCFVSSIFWQKFDTFFPYSIATDQIKRYNGWTTAVK